jgi:peptidylprolyl isomerase
MRRPFAVLSLPLLLGGLVPFAACAGRAAPGGAVHDAARRSPSTTAEVIDAAAPGEWRRLDPENTIYLELAGGRVVFELVPEFAPMHVENIKALARERYYDGLAVLRSQDNYVVQWGDPDGEDAERRRPVADAARTLPAEFQRAIDPVQPFLALAEGDIYAPLVGWASGFPAARDPARGRTWLAHCYGMLGSGRGDTADSGGGTELYVVIGHAPRHLDKNVTLVGRAVAGMELLSTLPRGTGGLGFYEKREEYVPVVSVRVAADVPSEERTDLELLRIDTPSFAALVEARRNRREEWFLDPVGKVELCNVPLPVRPVPPG